jgi:hypothetical protein
MSLAQTNTCTSGVPLGLPLSSTSAAAVALTTNVADNLWTVTLQKGIYMFQITYTVNSTGAPCTESYIRFTNTQTGSYYALNNSTIGVGDAFSAFQSGFLTITADGTAISFTQTPLFAAGTLTRNLYKVSVVKIA